MQHSKEQRKANRAHPKASTSKIASLSKPSLQMPACRVCWLVRQVASSLHQTSSLITPGTQTLGHVPYDATQRVAHPLPTHRVPVRLGDNSVV